MKIYVAGSFGDRNQILQIMKNIEAKGHIVTHYWPLYEVEKREKSDMAYHDIKGVEECDLLIAIMDKPDYPYRGSYTEIGAAIAYKKRIVIYCPDEKSNCKTNVFYYYPTIIHKSLWDDVWSYIDQFDLELKNDLNG